MPISADTTAIYIVPETAVGVTPATPSWMPFPITLESIAPNASSTVSNTLNPQRQVADSILTSLDVSGSLEVEFSRTPAMDFMLESMMANQWDITGAPAWQLPVLDNKLTFSLMKRWPDPVNAGQFIYQLYLGCTVNTLAINMTAGSEVTASFGIVGMTTDADRATTEPVGSTYQTLTDFEVLSAPDVHTIILDNPGGTLAPEIAGVCTTDMTFNANANVRGIQCLGTLGNKEISLGKFESTLDMTMFFTDNNIMEEFLNQEIIQAQFTIGEIIGSSNHYRFVYTRTKIASEQVVAGGTGTDVANTFSLQGIVDTALDPATTVTIHTVAPT